MMRNRVFPAIRKAIWMLIIVAPVPLGALLVASHGRTRILDFSRNFDERMAFRLENGCLIVNFNAFVIDDGSAPRNPSWIIVPRRPNPSHLFRNIEASKQRQIKALSAAKLARRIGDRFEVELAEADADYSMRKSNRMFQDMLEEQTAGIDPRVTFGGFVATGYSSPILRAMVARVPLIYPFSLSAGLALYPVLVGIRRRRRDTRRGTLPLCAHCGYDLSSNLSGVCPECGTGIPEDQRSRLSQMTKPNTRDEQGGAQ